MGMTERDQKVLAVVVALMVLGGYWFLVVGKKKSAIADAQAAQLTAQAELDSAKAAATAALTTAKVKPAAYSRLLRLGKAIPADKDFESLLVQVNNITADSLVSFVSLTASTNAAAVVKTGASETTTCDVTGVSGGASGSTPAAPAAPATGATGSTAVSSVGKNRDKAKGAVAASDGANTATENAANAASCDNSPTLTDIAATTAGLESEAYSFTFTGSFYRLKDVYNGLLDMVKVRNGRVSVSGRLLDINSISMSVASFPELSATVQMTGYKLPVATTSSGAEVPGTAPAGGSLAANATATANSENQSAGAE